MKPSTSRTNATQPRKDEKSAPSPFTKTLPSEQSGWSKSSYAPIPDQVPVDPVGTLSMLAAICGIALFWLPWLNLVFPMISISLGTVSLRRAGKDAFTWNLPAIGGLVLGSVLFLLGLFVIEVAGSLSEVLT